MKRTERPIIDLAQSINVTDERLFGEIPLESLNNCDCVGYLQDRHPVLQPLTASVVEKSCNGAGYEMKPHMDDGVIIRHGDRKPTNMYAKKWITISNKQTIYWKTPPPKYTAICYRDSHGKDFTGGELYFCHDNLVVKPRRNTYVLFDLMDIHGVHRMKSGQRRCIVIKFYEHEQGTALNN